jgi:hypothetical protein
VLQAQGRDGRQNPGHELAGALGAEAAAAPQDRAAQGAFGVVVGGFDPRSRHERPQGGLQLQDVRAGGRGLSLGQRRTRLEQLMYLLLDRLDRCLELGATQGAVTDAVPQVKHLVGLRQEGFPDHGVCPTPLQDGLEVPFEVRPAELAAQGGEPVVAPPAVRADDAGIRIAQQLLGTLGAAAGQHEKDRDLRRRGQPHPVASLTFPPTGLIGVDGRLGLHIGLGGGVAGLGNCARMSLNSCFSQPCRTAFVQLVTPFARNSPLAGRNNVNNLAVPLRMYSCGCRWGCPWLAQLCPG